MKTIFLTAAVFLAVSSSAALQAATVTFAYEATVSGRTGQQDNPNTPDFRQVYAPNDIIRGTFSYDTSQAPTESLSMVNVYQAGFSAVTLQSNGFNADFSTNANATRIETVGIEVSQSDAFDGFRIFARSSPVGGLGVQETVSISLTDSSKTALVNKNLPLDFDFSVFGADMFPDQLVLSLFELTSDRTGNIFSSGRTSVIADITSIQKVSAVPLPGTGLLILTGLVGLRFARKRIAPVRDQTLA